VATMDNVAASPCGFLDMDLEEVLAALSGMGYRKFEAFTTGKGAGLDPESDADLYVNLAKKYGMSYSSVHLPVVGEDLHVGEAVEVARFAASLGAPVVIFKAASRQAYIRSARAFLDAIEGLPVTPVLQNHYGTPISSLADYREVIDGIGDPRMKTLLEVGHFQMAGIAWEEGYELLKGSIALVHVKDMIGAQPVEFGTGEVDLPKLWATMCDAGYTGDFVIEMETEPREKRLALMGQAYEYIKRNCV